MLLVKRREHGGEPSGGIHTWSIVSGFQVVRHGVHLVEKLVLDPHSSMGHPDLLTEGRYLTLGAIEVQRQRIIVVLSFRPFRHGAII